MDFQARSLCLSRIRQYQKPHSDGGKNPTFQEKFVYTMIEGLKELNIIVWNSNTISRDDFIGSGKVHLALVISGGYDDSSWPLQTKKWQAWWGGTIDNALFGVPMPSYVTASVPHVSMYSAPPVSTGAYPMSSPYASYAPYPPSDISSSSFNLSSSAI